VSTLERLCAEADIDENSLQRITVRDKLDLCVSRLNGQVYAVVDRCGHMNAPLSRGELEGDVVTCPVHHAQFSLATGAVVRRQDERSGPSADGRVHSGTARLGLDDLVRVIEVKRFKVSAKDGSLYVELP
jgi:3-phenylpropionate/trans-cinnamate dioxygenase ferredoxin subunit